MVPMHFSKFLEIGVESNNPLVNSLICKIPVSVCTMENIRNMFPRCISAICADGYTIELELSNGIQIGAFCFFLKNGTSTRLEMLIDETCVDMPGFKPRFTIICILLSLYFNRRVNIVYGLSDYTQAKSLTNIYGGAGWAEREIWDLFGVPFECNKDLRRLVTDYGFRGHPLRKDFPLSGYKETFYTGRSRRVVSTKISLVQEYRGFSFSNPWSVKSPCSL